MAGVLLGLSPISRLTVPTVMSVVIPATRAGSADAVPPKPGDESPAPLGRVRSALVVLGFIVGMDGVLAGLGVVAVGLSDLLKRSGVVNRPGSGGATETTRKWNSLIERVFDDNFGVYDVRKIWKQLKCDGHQVRPLPGRDADLRARAVRCGARQAQAHHHPRDSRRSVGWRCSTSLRTDLAADPLEQGLWQRQRDRHQVAGLAHHSDRGVKASASATPSAWPLRALSGRSAARARATTTSRPSR